MRDKVLKMWPRIVLCLLLVLVLALIRAYESELFYDPFARYFEGDYLNFPFPDFDLTPLIGSLSARYGLNMIVSLAIIYVLFKDRQMLQFSSFLYVLFFVALLAAFLVIVLAFDREQNFYLFYVRRFLIQPLFLLLFVPAFYYQSKIAKKQ